MELLLTLLTAVAALIGLVYYIRVSYRQEKAILVFFIQEFSLLLRRSTMYYGQMLKGAISFSTLFQITDASSFGKLSEVVKNPKIIETALYLKARFFQVTRYADMASIELANRNRSPDTKSKDKHESTSRMYQSLAVTFLMGDQLIDGEFSRTGIDKVINKMDTMLDYLSHVNSRFTFLGPLIYFSPKLSKELASINAFVVSKRRELRLIEEKVHLLREKEKLLITRGIQ